jgi:hypothetical protein
MSHSVGFVHIWLQNRIPLEKVADSVCLVLYFVGHDLRFLLSAVHLKQDLISLAAIAC